MKLKNKISGEIKEFALFDGKELQGGATLESLTKEWEDYEEPKEWWYIDIHGPHKVTNNDEYYQQVKAASKEIGNYFETKEEAEKAVEKLKAIQRLKNYYLKFKLDFVKNKIDFTYRLDGTLHSSVDEERIIFEDMNLLFGGEE